MIGNYVNNSQIISLRERGILKIEPFNPQNLRDAHYPLNPAGVRVIGEDREDGQRAYTNVDFAQHSEFKFAPNQFALVEVEERVVIGRQIFAEFAQNSTLIEAGFLVVTGKLDAGYGEAKGQVQKLIFGMKNLLDRENTYRPGMGLAWISFVDQRGMNNFDFNLDDSDFIEWVSRYARFKRANDDGPSYGQGS